MKPSCPNILCTYRTSFVKDGTFYRPSDGRKVQRYRCKSCGKRFSHATHHPAYRQNKRRVNYPLQKLLCSGVSMRRCAKILNIHSITVARKLRYLAKVARMKQEKYLLSFEKFPIKQMQFDDLLTIEHTKCKPLSVTLAVEKNKRIILGAEVSSMPAFGHLAELSRKRYGGRADDRKQGIEKLFSKIQKAVDSQATIISDEHQLYPAMVKKYFPNSEHVRHKGGRGCIAGQGELKKLHWDPLFSLNHTCAMLRANINRLIRRTWCSTKDPERLADHLAIYLHYHNQELIR